MRVELSYEERILNRLHGMRFPRGTHFMERDRQEHAAIRAILQPLYDRISELEAQVEATKEGENRAESVAQLASFNLELGERNAKLREALHDTAIRLDADARGYYMRCEICDTETDCGGEVNFTLAEHSPDCLLATSSTEATE